MDTISRAEHETLLAAARTDAHAFGVEAGKAEAAASITAARTEGAQAERTRIGSILGCDEARGREAQAQYVALESDMSVEAATKFLSKSPAAPAQASRLARTPNPNVKPDPTGAEGKADASAGWDDIVAGMNAVHGFKR